MNAELDANVSLAYRLRQGRSAGRGASQHAAQKKPGHTSFGFDWANNYRSSDLSNQQDLSTSSEILRCGQVDNNTDASMKNGLDWRQTLGLLPNVTLDFTRDCNRYAFEYRSSAMQ